MKAINPGDVFGRLTIVRKLKSDNGVIWLCQCSCGKQAEARTSVLNRTLKQGGVSSCGCYHYLAKRREDGLYRCSVCHAWLAAECFSKSKWQAAGLTSSCKSCQQEYREANREQRLATKRAYHHRTKDSFKDRRKEYRARTKDAINARSARWRAQNPERRREVANDWVKRNRVYGTYRATLRRAQQLQATPAWAEHDKIKLMYEKSSELGFEVDHVVPLNSDLVCGLHCWANLQLLSKEENLKKSNRYWPDMP